MVPADSLLGAIRKPAHELWGKSDPQISPAGLCAPPAHHVPSPHLPTLQPGSPCEGLRAAARMSPGGPGTQAESWRSPPAREKPQT